MPNNSEPRINYPMFLALTTGLGIMCLVIWGIASFMTGSDYSPLVYSAIGVVGAIVLLLWFDTEPFGLSVQMLFFVTALIAPVLPALVTQGLIWLFKYIS